MSAWKSKTVQKKKAALKSKTIKKSSRRVTFKNDKETLMKPPGNTLVFNTRNSVSNLLSRNKKNNQNEYNQFIDRLESTRIKLAGKRKTGKKSKRKRRRTKKR
jgi:hypothetical protein